VLGSSGDHALIGHSDLRYLFEDCVLDTDRRELFRGSRPVPVEPQVFDLLVHLLRNRERVVSRDDLLAARASMLPDPLSGTAARCSI
jgi:DNA-binding response OmpR family regulator